MRSFAFICVHDTLWTQICVHRERKLRSRERNERKWTQFSRKLRSFDLILSWTQMNANFRQIAFICVHLRSFAFICAHERKWTQFLIFSDFKLRERKLNAINKIAFICVHGLKIAKTCERKWTQMNANLRSPWTQFAFMNANERNFFIKFYLRSQQKKFAFMKKFAFIKMVFFWNNFKNKYLPTNEIANCVHCVNAICVHFKLRSRKFIKKFAFINLRSRFCIFKLKCDF